MKYLAILCVLFITACSKSIDKPASLPAETEKLTCTFGFTEFNLSKRPTIHEEVAKGKPANNGNNNSSNSSPNVILLDFNGQYVSGTSWNVFGDINCAPANLSTVEINNIVQRVIADFNPFNVTITTEESVYNNANPLKRMRIIITESWEWFGQAGGVAYLNSFTWGNNTPCFVFSSLLNYNLKNIAEACSHEAGHTLGLRHQSAYDASGVKISEYNWGQGSGEIGWAPIMGAGYNRNLTLWHNGPNSISSTSMQNEVSIIAGVVGLSADDYANTSSNATVLSTSRTGIMNSSTDIDFFSVNLSTSKTVLAAPQHVGSNNDGGNLDLVLKVYNSQGSLLAVVDDANTLNASITLSPGTYYLSLSTVDNIYTSRYGMLSRYNISLY